MVVDCHLFLLILNLMLNVPEKKLILLIDVII